MHEEGKYQRLLDREDTPTERQIIRAIGSKSAKSWNDLRAFLRSNYDYMPEFGFQGMKYGWAYKYRRKGKTLCVLYPEAGAFTILVTLGKKEVESAERNLSHFNEDTRRVFHSAFQYHDGKWIYKRILSNRDLRDAKLLLTIKRKPKGSAG